jgi:hypothetical protein
MAASIRDAILLTPRREYATRGRRARPATTSFGMAERSGGRTGASAAQPTSTASFSERTARAHDHDHGDDHEKERLPLAHVLLDGLDDLEAVEHALDVVQAVGLDDDGGGEDDSTCAA